MAVAANFSKKRWWGKDLRYRFNASYHPYWYWGKSHTRDLIFAGEHRQCVSEPNRTEPSLTPGPRRTRRSVRVRVAHSAAVTLLRSCHVFSASPALSLWVYGRVSRPEPPLRIIQSGPWAHSVPVRDANSACDAWESVLCVWNGAGELRARIYSL